MGPRFPACAKGGGDGLLCTERLKEIVEQGQFDFGVLDFGLWEGIFNTIDG